MHWLHWVWCTIAGGPHPSIEASQDTDGNVEASSRELPSLSKSSENARPTSLQQPEKSSDIASLIDPELLLHDSKNIQVDGPSLSRIEALVSNQNEELGEDQEPGEDEESEALDTFIDNMQSCQSASDKLFALHCPNLSL